MKDTEAGLDHYLHPRNQGTLDDPDAQAVVHNPACGDTTRLCLKIERGVIATVRWQTEGCATSIATSSVMSEMLEGRSLDAAASLDRATIDRAMGGLMPAKQHCAVLAADAIKAALGDYRSRTTTSKTVPNRATA